MGRGFVLDRTSSFSIDLATRVMASLPYRPPRSYRPMRWVAEGPQPQRQSRCLHQKEQGPIDLGSGLALLLLL